MATLIAPIKFEASMSYIFTAPTLLFQSDATGEMEEKQLDFVMVPLGLLFLTLYHSWLLVAILRRPNTTVIGLNALARRRWVQAMMADSLKNGVLAVQTVRNNIMASTLLATTAITLASLISVFVTATTKSSTSSVLVYGNNTSLASSVKLFSISLCYILAFLCHVQAIRYYAHVSFLVTTPPTGVDGTGDFVSVMYVSRSLNRASLFWSLGLRAFYVSFTLFMWIFGPFPMFASCIVMCSLLYFLDTTTEHTRDLHESCHRRIQREEREDNV